MRRIALAGLFVAILVGCGPQDVTGDSVDDAMNERAAKAKALDEKEGVKPVDNSAEKSQDPQAGGGSTTGGEVMSKTGGAQNANTAGD